MIPAGIRSFLRNSGYVLIGHVSTTLFAFGYAVALARVLGKDSYGILAYGFAWYLTIIAFSYLGLDVLLGREIGRVRSDAPMLAGSTLTLRAAGAAFCAVVSSILGAVVAPDPTAKKLLALFGIALFARAIWLWCTSIFSAFEDTRHGFLIDLTCRPLEPAVATVVLLLIAPKSVIAIGIVHVAVWSLQAAIGLIVVVRHVTPIDFRSARSDAKRLLKAGLPGALYALTVVWFLQAPIVLFTQFGGKEQRGPFALAMQILGYLLIVPYLAGNVALPVLSRSASRRDGKTRRAAIASLIGIPAVGLVIGLLAVLLAPTMARLVFGAQYTLTGAMMQEAVWLLIPASVAMSMQQIEFSTSGRSKIGTTSAIVGMAAMAALYAPLSHSWNYHGALIATGIGLVIWAAGLVISVLSEPDRSVMAAV